MVEERNHQEEAEQIADMRARLAEEQVFYHFSQEAQQQARAWEHVERNSYHAQLRNYEHRVCQEASQKRLNMEAAVGQQFLAFRQELSKPRKSIPCLSVKKQDSLPRAPEPSTLKKCIIIIIIIIIIRLLRLGPISLSCRAAASQCRNRGASGPLAECYGPSDGGRSRSAFGRSR